MFHRFLVREWPRHAFIPSAGRSLPVDPDAGVIDRDRAGTREVDLVLLVLGSGGTDFRLAEVDRRTFLVVVEERQIGIDDQVAVLDEVNIAAA